MESLKVASSRLFVTSIIESKRDETEEKLEQGYQKLQELISGLSEKEAHDALNSAVSKDKAHEEEVSLGLLCVILSEPQNAQKIFRDLALVTRDGLTMVMAHLTHIVSDKWLRMNDVARSQLLWLLRELIRTGVAGVDQVCFNLMRHAAGGDLSPRNIALVDYLLDTFIENRNWLEKYPFMVAIVVYNYLRLVEDHIGLQHTALRQKEVTFLVSLLRDRFADCLVIGRDLVRLLQNVARIPEFEMLWKDILNNPKSLCPSFTGVLQLLQSRTSRRFLQGRLTPEMERKIVFLTSHVRFGHHKRYQDWFQKQYLATPESQTLRIDLIRFIVGVIHPTNELLCSDIIPRWAIIGWLLTTCTSHVAAANAKLALFYDWLFFDPERDNIMNIEPGILVMHNSTRSHLVVTATLLDFLCRIIPNFYPPLTDKVREGIYASLRHIIDKRVLPSLFPLLAHDKLDKDLRLLVKETFQEFCYQPFVEGVPKVEATLAVKEEMGNHMDLGLGTLATANNHRAGANQTEPAFSDDEAETTTQGPTVDDDDDDDIPLAKVKLKGSPSPDEWKENDKMFAGLEGTLRSSVERLNNETDNEAMCEAMEQVVQQVLQDEEADSDSLAALGQCLCRVLGAQWAEREFPIDAFTPEAVEDSIGRPLFVLFRNLAELNEDDNRRLPLLTVLSEMYSQQQKIGYLLLYYLQACLHMDEDSSKNNSNSKSQVYKELCETQDKEVEAGLLADLKLCQEDDPRLLCWLLPAVYTQFPQVAVGNTALLHVVVSTVDASQLQDLVARVVQGRLVMFRGDSFQVVLSASLSWETFEQFCLWQLVAAHGIPIDYVMPILPRLEYTAHSEALTAILLMLKHERPTAELLRQVLCRDTKPAGDMFAVSVLRCWCREHEDRLAELVAAQLALCYAGTSPTKRKRGKGGGGGSPAPERLLAHLDRLRHGCRQLYKLDCMQRALQQAQTASSDSQKSHFSNLFALVELDDPGRGKGRGRKSNSTAKSKQKNYRVSDTSEESSEEEEVVIKMKQARKRKKTNPVYSDSD